MVVGTSGSGKTRFARALSEKLAVPHIELDALHWLADWRERPLDEFRTLVARAAQGDRWVIDGNYGVVRDLTWPRATAVIWLNYSFPRTFWRVFSRTVKRCATREELFAGNRESLAMTFCSRDSILLWTIQTYHRRQRKYRKLFDGDDHAHLGKIEFGHPAKATRALHAHFDRSI